MRTQMPACWGQARGGRIMQLHCPTCLPLVLWRPGPHCRRCAASARAAPPCWWPPMWLPVAWTSPTSPTSSTLTCPPTLMTTCTGEQRIDCKGKPFICGARSGWLAGWRAENQHPRVICAPAAACPQHSPHWHAPVFTCSLTWLGSSPALVFPCSGLSPVHRPVRLSPPTCSIGRTGRAGKKGLATAFFSEKDTGAWMCVWDSCLGCKCAPAAAQQLRMRHCCVTGSGMGTGCAWRACGCELPAAPVHMCCWPANWLRLLGSLPPASLPAPACQPPPASPAPFTHSQRSPAALCRPVGQAGGDSERDQPGGARLAAEHGPGQSAAADQRVSLIDSGWFGAAVRGARSCLRVPAPRKAAATAMQSSWAHTMHPGSKWPAPTTC